MDINILISIIIGPIIAFTRSTVKNPASVAKLKKSLPVINQAIDALTQLRDAITQRKRSSHFLLINRQKSRHTRQS